MCFFFVTFFESIDISGSMSSTIEAPKDMVLLNLDRATERRLAMERELAQFMEAGANQNFGRSNQVKFLSRLECVQAAAHHAVSQLVKMLPDYVPVLVTFASDVKVYHADGSVTTKAGDGLNDLNGSSTLVSSGLCNMCFFFSNKKACLLVEKTSLQLIRTNRELRWNKSW